MGGKVRHFNSFYWTCVLFGVILSLGAPFLFLIIPIFSLYYFLIRYIVAPFFKGLGGPIYGIGNWFATEFLGSKSHLTPPRCSIVVSMYIEGTSTKEEFMEDIKSKWIDAKDHRGNLKYPELQQYIEEWMGFMFWKQDENFQMENHFFAQEIEDNVTPVACKGHVDQYIETLLNKPFAPKRSPWDIHFLYNYRDPDFLQKTDEDRVTVFLFRCHHAMADGFSIVTLLVEDLLGLPLSSCKIATRNESPTNATSYRFLSGLKYIVTFPMRLLHDIGFPMIPLLKNVLNLDIPVPYSSGEGHMLYLRSPMIPVKKLKDLKRKLSCSFFSILLSSVSASFAHFYDTKGHDDKRRRIQPFSLPLPAKAHSQRLSNEVSGSILHLCIDKGLTPLERLQATEGLLSDARESVLHLMMPLLFKFASILPARLVQVLFRNRIFPAGITTFPGPGIQVAFRGRKILSTHFSAGILIGVGAIGVMVLSYHDHIQFSVIADSNLFKREEMEGIMRNICDEIDRLDAISNNSILQTEE